MKNTNRRLSDLSTSKKDDQGLFQKMKVVVDERPSCILGCSCYATKNLKSWKKFSRHLRTASVARQVYDLDADGSSNRFRCLLRFAAGLWSRLSR